MAEQHQTIAGHHNVAVQNSGDGNSFTITVGAETRLHVTRSHRLGVPVTRPLHLLLAENQVAPLVGRDAVKADLDAWLDRAQPIAVRLVTGEAGSGKTRLALDLCARAEARGWHAGFVAADELARFHARTNVEAFTTDAPTLLVVDYAAAKSAILKRWLTALARIEQLPAAGKLRLLLLERHGSRESGWWQQLVQLGGIESARLEALLDPPEPVPLAPITTPRHRRLVLRTVMAEASALEGLDPPLAPPAAGEDPWFDRRLEEPAADNSPLLLHMAALAAVQARRSHALDRSRTELALALADDERVRLQKLAEGRGIEPGDLQHLVAAVTVEGGADVDALHRLLDEERRALDLAASPAALRDAVRAALPPVAGDGAATAPRLLDAVRPDLIGEALVLRTWARDDVSTAVQDDHVARCWARAPAATAEALVRLGQDFRARDAAHAADPDADPAPIRWLDRRIEAADDADLELLTAALPEATVNLREVAERAESRLIARLDAAPEPDRLRLAMLRGNRALRLNDLGRQEPARDDEVAARDLFRALVTEVDAATFEPLLAAALNNLSATESRLGRREDALQAGDEAVAIRRRLAQDRPDAFLPDLAQALNNVSDYFSNLGRREDALQASEDAVETYRRLAQDRPDAFLPDLAAAFNNLGIRYSKLGRPEDALKASEDAVTIQRRLAQDRPDAFLPDLARSLAVRANALAALDRMPEAVASDHEAVSALSTSFLALPQAFAGLMLTCVQLYVRRAEAAGIAPDDELLAPLLPALEPFIRQPGSDEG